METAPPLRPRSPVQAPSGLLLLTLLCLLAVGWQLAGRARTLPPERVSPQLRLLEWRLIWAEGNPTSLGRVASSLGREPQAPWDALALGTWLHARGQGAAADQLLAQIPGTSGAHPYRVWAQSPFQPAPPECALRLGGSLAGGLARGEAPEQLLSRARQTLHGISALLATGLALGIGFLFWLLALDRHPRPTPPPLPLSGTALLQVFLLWFLALQVSGPLAGAMISLAPALRPLAMPLAYSLHAGAAVLALKTALKPTPLSGCFPRLRPDFRLFVWVSCFSALSLLGLVAMGWGIGPWWPFKELPQRELGEHLARIQGLELGAFFVTAALMAPVFEEFLFRGVLQPWLSTNLPSRRGRTAWAVLAGGALFGAIHLEPGAFPTLSTLGFCFGWAALRSGNLWVPILLHALWNGSLVLLNRSFLVPWT